MQWPSRRAPCLNQLLLSVGTPAGSRVDVVAVRHLGRELARLLVGFLPLGGAAGTLPDLDGGDFVFRTVRGPVGEFGRDDVDGAAGEVERRVDDAGLHALRDLSMQRRFALA